MGSALSETAVVPADLDIATAVGAAFRGSLDAAHRVGEAVAGEVAAEAAAGMIAEVEEVGPIPEDLSGPGAAMADRKRARTARPLCLRCPAGCHSRCSRSRPFGLGPCPIQVLSRRGGARRGGVAVAAAAVLKGIAKTRFW